MISSSRYVSVQLLNILLTYASPNDFDLDTLLKMSGIHPDILQNKNAKIGIEDFSALISLMVKSFGNDFTGLQLAQKVNNIYSKNHILMTIMSNCANLERAIEKLVQYHDISSNIIKLHLRKQPTLTELILNIEISFEPKLAQVFLEAVTASFVIIFRELTRANVGFAEVHFTHSATAEQDAYQRIFNCPIRFSSKENKLVFSNDNLLTPIVLSDPELLDMLERYAQKLLSSVSSENILSEQVMNYLSEMIIQGKECSIHHVATKMAVGIRTLQKQLKQENTSYRELLEQVKKNIAIHSLEDGETSLTDIAFLLGFSEQSAFNHAFKNWTGLSPTKYRKDV